MYIHKEEDSELKIVYQELKETFAIRTKSGDSPFGYSLNSVIDHINNCDKKRSVILSIYAYASQILLGNIIVNDAVKEVISVAKKRKVLI